MSSGSGEPTEYPEPFTSELILDGGDLPEILLDFDELNELNEFLSPDQLGSVFDWDIADNDEDNSDDAANDNKSDGVAEDDKKSEVAPERWKIEKHTQKETNILEKDTTEAEPATVSSSANTSLEVLEPTTPDSALQLQSTSIAGLQEPKELNLDLEEDEQNLIDDLAKLSIENWNKCEVAVEDYLPPYLYCQPCGDNPGWIDTYLSNELPSTKELDQPKLSVENRDKRKVSVEDLLPPYPYCQPCDESPDLIDTCLSNELPSIKDLDRLSLDNDLIASLLDLNLIDFDAEDSILDGIEPEPELMENNNQQQGHEHDHDHEYPEPVQYMPRPAAINASRPVIDSFQKDRTCLGHKESVFNLAFSECGGFFVSASQDSTAIIWNAEKNSQMARLDDHDKGYECLRVAWASTAWSNDKIDRSKGGDYSQIVATGCADGMVKLWSTKDPSRKDSWKCFAKIDHFSFLGRNTQDGEKKDTDSGADNGDKGSGVENNDTEESAAGGDEDGEKAEDAKPDKPQVYALQFVDHWRAFTKSDDSSASRNSFLITSSDDYIHLWEIESSPRIQEISLDQDVSTIEDEIKLKEVMSLHFGAIEHYKQGVEVCNITEDGIHIPTVPEEAPKTDTPNFGGERNPNNAVFVFDSDYNAASGLLGVALSDGSLRLINGRGICVSVITLPGCHSHLTSFAWNGAGTRIATCVATGHMILWALDADHGNIVATCLAIMEGGHQPGRPLYGCAFYGPTEDLVLSWGVDGRVCLWDSFSEGNIHSPISVLRDDKDYPIYAVVFGEKCVAVGGGREGGFLGIPVYLYDYAWLRSSNKVSS